MAPPKNPFCGPLLLILVFSSAAAAAAASDDADAMWELAKNLGNVPPSWKPGSDPCDDSWESVTCSSGRVTSINCPSLSLSGSLPAALGRLTALQRLFLPGNAISGPLPSISDLSSLQELHLDGNALSSIPATFFSGLSALTSVSLDDNPFAPWSLSDDLAQAASLLDFSASNASVTGSLPSFFAALPSLHSLSLSYNHLTGDLPASFAASAIRTLKLNNQKSADKLSGRIDVIASMTQLTLTWLQSNSFTGPIPDLSNLTALSSFNVRDNQLTGLVPDSLTSSPVLNEVALSNNKLQGPFPVFASKNITTLDVDKGNNFCSPKPGPCDPRVAVLLSVAAGFGFPLSLASSWEGNDPCASEWSGVLCDAQGKNVTVLNFMNQHFNGTISPDIANLTSLTKLVLGNNSLTGRIPDSLTSLPQLQLLDVSNNNLEGKVPAFAQRVVLKLAGNPSLGKESSSPGGGGSSSRGGGDSGSPVDGTPSPSSGNQYGKSNSSSTGMVVGIVIAALVLIGCCLATFLYLRHKKQALRFGRVQTQSPPNEPEDVKIGVDLNVNNGAVNELYSQSSTGSTNTLIGENRGMVMSIQALRTATNNFSEDNILGSGGFGVVYKGNLNGSLVAVKRSNSTDQKGLAEFKAEIDVLRKVRHRHLVALLGYCMDGADRLLVYEYMSEGTLGQHLFGQNESRYSPLTWKQRLTIALDVARGIEYLHSLAQESFIHRDLKPSNILLDKDMRAKVSDFGLVKLANNQASMMTRLAGTFGYLAPEYALTGKVTTKVDVYAFGVVLMELILSRRALEETLPDDQTHLVTYFRRLILNKVKFMESVQSLNLDEEGCRSVIGVAELACHCTAREPSQRPDMSHAVNVLAPLVDQWKPSRYNDEDACGDSGTLTLEDLQMSDSSFSSNLYSRYT